MFERLQTARVSATRTVGVFSCSSNLRLLNLIESKLDDKKEILPNDLIAKFAQGRCVPLQIQSQHPYILLLEAVCFFPFCPRSSLSFRGNIPFSFDLRVNLSKLHIYPPNLTFIFSC